jgi:hypothetical protein
MEEKDVNNIANAVSNALAKLNADTAAVKEKEEGKPETPEEIFKCPECDAPVKGGIGFCQSCGCPLEWGE